MKKANKTSRKELKNKMAKAINHEIKTLPAGMQEILVDDLVTAFQNRLKIIKQVAPNFQYYVELGVTVPQ
jgi:hypothetical protein